MTIQPGQESEIKEQDPLKATHAFQSSRLQSTPRATIVPSTPKPFLTFGFFFFSLVAMSFQGLELAPSFSEIKYLQNSNSFFFS